MSFRTNSEDWEASVMMVHKLVKLWTLAPASPYTEHRRRPCPTLIFRVSPGLRGSSCSPGPPSPSIITHFFHRLIVRLALFILVLPLLRCSWRYLSNSPRHCTSPRSLMIDSVAFEQRDNTLSFVLDVLSEKRSVLHDLTYTKDVGAYAN